MARYLSYSCTPIEMIVEMRSRQFPDLVREFEKICGAPDLTHEEMHLQIKQTIELYHMRLDAGLIQRGAMRC